MERNPVPQGRVRRTLPVAGFTARATGGRMVAALRAKTGDDDAVVRFHEKTADRYAQLLGHSKGVLMKAGQILSMVDTKSVGDGGFSPYQKALSRLQADAPPMDPALAREVAQVDLGRPVEELYAEFSDEPIAAASIGQVHRATLHDGRRVAVKIQYPGAAQAIRADLANTELLATFFRLVCSASGTTMPDLRQATREITARITEEVDYRREAANITAFSELYRGHPFIRIPQVIDAACGDRVLTMTYLDGLDWSAAQHADQDLKNTWAEVLWRFSGGSHRHANFFHADPHPANFCFGPDGQVGVVDFGCIKVIPEKQRRNLIGLSRAVIEARKSDVRDLMTALGYFSEGVTLSVDEAYQWMAEIHYEVLAAQPVAYDQSTSERAVGALVDVRRDSDHPVRRVTIPGDLILFSRINLTANVILARLGASVDARSIVDDLDGVAEPTTSLGKQHDAWVRERGLPYGREPHDHP